MNNINMEEPESQYKVVPEKYLCKTITLTKKEHNIIKEGRQSMLQIDFIDCVYKLIKQPLFQEAYVATVAGNNAE